METSIDDAIMSRATAHLVYGAPSEQDQFRIWKVLGDQFNAGLSESQYQELVEKYPNLVGRDIKAMLKLALMYSRGKGVELSVDLFEGIHGFIPKVMKNNFNK